MGRFKCRVKLSRDGGLPNKRDTPVKTALSRRDKCRRLLPNKNYEAFPEETVEENSVLPVGPTSPVLTSITPVHCKSVNLRGKAVLPAAPGNKKSGHQVSPAVHPTIQMSPDADAFNGDEMQVKEEEQNLAVTPESIASSNMESDATFSSDDDQEDCYSSASTSSSSLPSPEIFRKENYVETLTFPIKEELLGLHLNVKNSTLLDVSHAESIHMHHPPNLSTIIDTSALLAENNCEINQHRGHAETKIHMDSFKSDKAFKRKSPPKLTNRKPFLCKKKVSFKSPIIAEIFEPKHIPATKLTIHNSIEPVKTSSPAEQMKLSADTSRTGEISSKEEALRLTVRLKRTVKSSPEKAKFFDFNNDSDKDAFFQTMRERCAKLRGAPLFPLTAAKHVEPSVLRHAKPKHYSQRFWLSPTT